GLQDAEAEGRGADAAAGEAQPAPLRVLAQRLLAVDAAPLVDEYPLLGEDLIPRVETRGRRLHAAGEGRDVVDRRVIGEVARAHPVVAPGLRVLASRRVLVDETVLRAHGLTGLALT